MHEHKGWGGGGGLKKQIQIEWVTTLPDLLALYSILFHKHIKDTNKALTEKVFLTSCNHGQKFQINCALSRLSDTKGTAS